MISKGIRGAITVEENTEVAIKNATNKLLEALIEKNNIEPHFISHVIFSLTADLNAALMCQLILNFISSPVVLLITTEPISFLTGMPF